jgi:hypothetical protein
MYYTFLVIFFKSFIDNLILGEHFIYIKAAAFFPRAAWVSTPSVPIQHSLDIPGMVQAGSSVVQATTYCPCVNFPGTQSATALETLLFHLDFKGYLRKT